MKKILLLTILILSGISSFGQKIRFSDSTNVWHYLNCSSGIIPPYAWPFMDYYISDTVIHGINYRRLANELAYIREDTILNKVFAIMPVFDTDTTEKLLYDYNLTIGDTFKNISETYYVASIDSVIISGIWYKVWYFNLCCMPYVQGFTAIEGIGSLSETCSPITPLPSLIESGSIITCFDHKGTAPPLSPKFGPYFLDIDRYPYYFDNDTSCSYNPLNIKMVFNKNQISTIFPNPITESTKIQLPYSITSGSLTITNTLGQIITQTPVQNKQEFLIGAQIKTPGIYFYRVTDNSSGESFTGKFVY